MGHSNWRFVFEQLLSCFLVYSWLLDSMMWSWNLLVRDKIVIIFWQISSDDEGNFVFLKKSLVLFWKLFYVSEFVLLGRPILLMFAEKEEPEKFLARWAVNIRLFSCYRKVLFFNQFTFLWLCFLNICLNGLFALLTWKQIWYLTFRRLFCSLVW